MLEGGKITGRQAIWLLVIDRLSLAFAYVPALISPPENQDVWITVALSLPLALVLAAPALLLALRFPRQSLIQCSRVLLGKAGAIIGFLYVWFFLHVGAITVRQFGEFLDAVPMPETPLLVFILGITVLAASAVRNGLEVIGRLADIIVPVSIGSVLLVVVLVAKEADVKALTPVLEKGMGSVMFGAFTIAARITESVLIISMVIPYLDRPQSAVKVVGWSFAVIVAVFILIVISIITVFGPAQAKALAFPFSDLVRMVNVLDVVERIEVIHIGIWVLGTFLKVAVLFYLAALGVSQLLSLKTYRPVILPMGGLLVALSIWLFDSLVALKEFGGYKIWTPYVLLFTVVIPLFLLLVALVTRKGGATR